MKKASAVVTGHLTISNSNKLPMNVKEKIVEAPEGQAREFRKVLVDPETGKEVVIKGVARVGGCDKDGKPIKGRNQSLTAYVAIHLDNVESIFVPVKSKDKELDLEAMAESLGIDLTE